MPEPTADNSADETPTPVQPIDAKLAARLAWRGVWSARLARIGLICIGVAGFLLAQQNATMPAGLGLLFGATFGWMALVGRTARNQMDLIRVPAWLEAHDFARVEAAIPRALGKFSVSVKPRLQALQSLAVARHGQKKFADARLLAEAMLGYRQPKVVTDPLRLLVAECALNANDLVAAHAALSEVVEPVPVRLSLKLLELQTDYCVRVGAWPHVASDLPRKIDLVELLPAESAAMVQALFALAMRHLNQPAWSDWLARRAALLVPAETLVARCPPLALVYPPASQAA